VLILEKHAPQRRNEKRKAIIQKISRSLRLCGEYLLVLRVNVVVWPGSLNFARNAVFLAGPFAEVNQTTAFAAKGPPGM
jgi:hypothetical protein